MALQAHILRFEINAATQIQLRQHKGSALRGAFFHALREFCTYPTLTSCRECSLHSSCPVCFLVSTVDDAGERGIDLPRPYVIEPPTDDRTQYQPGDELDFNIVLFSRALTLYPYVIVAARRMGELGWGVGRGKFTIREVWAMDPLAGIQQRVLRQGDNLVKVPDIPIGQIQVAEMANAIARQAGNRVCLRFKTPLRLVTDGRLVHRLSLSTLMRRLFERLTVLWGAYSDEPLSADFSGLLGLAEKVRVVRDDTYWLDVDRFSARQKRSMPMGGLVGEIVFEGELAPLLPWLVWGSITHVGKYAVMGNGWYEIAADECSEAAHCDWSLTPLALS